MCFRVSKQSPNAISELEELLVQQETTYFIRVPGSQVDCDSATQGLAVKYLRHRGKASIRMRT